MSTSDPKLTKIELAKFDEQLRTVLGQVADGTAQAVIEEDGKQLAAIVSIADLRQIQRHRSFQALETFSRGFDDVPLAELEQQVSDAVRATRSERRVKREGSPASG